MKITSFPVGPLGCNCSIVADGGQAIVVDPGGDLEKIRAVLSEGSLTVMGIVHTHTHFDHVGATAPLQRWSGAAARIHEKDRFLYDMLPLQAALFGASAAEACEMEGDLNDGAVVSAGSLELAVMHTPGHTPGSVCFLLQGGDRPIVLTGDTLFRGGIGRTDLWGGDEGDIIRSLRDRLLTLDDDVIVVPGHGPATTIGDERAMNPFVR